MFESNWVWMAAVSAAAVGLPVCGWLLHRLCLRLEERGWIYYRKKSSGASNAAGALMELDRFTRPSVEHVVEAQTNPIRQQQSGIDGE